MFAADADFSTPIGCRTNTLVYAVGRYGFLDFTKAGPRLNNTFWAVSSVILRMVWSLD